MTTAVLVRRAVPDDADAIAVLQDIANKGHLSAHDWRADDRDWRSVGAELVASNRTEMGIANTIVAERNGAVVGMLNYAPDANAVAVENEVFRPFIRLRELLHPCLYLRAMAVLPNERRSGIAGRLLDVAMAAAAAMDDKAVGVIVHESNAGLLRHYTKRGFARIGAEPVLRHHAYPVGSMLIALRRRGGA